jgi:DNA-binding LacI/PurR family transcriptional regulator
MIAVMISDITNPFYFPIIRGAQAAAAEVGYTMLLADAQESDVLEREALDRALPTVEGILLATSRMSDSAIHATAKQKPMMVLNRAVADVPSLVTDNPGGVRKAVEHLAHLGHRSITYIAGPEAPWVDGIRWRSLLDSAKEHGIHTRRIGPNAPTVTGGEQAAAALTNTWSTAYLAFNDQVAIRFIRRLMATGTKVPEEASVVGFDKIFAADLITPPLTTIAAPPHVRRTTAVRNLLAIINGATPRAREP